MYCIVKGILPDSACFTTYPKLSKPDEDRSNKYSYLYWPKPEFSNARKTERHLTIRICLISDKMSSLASVDEVFLPREPEWLENRLIVHALITEPTQSTHKDRTTATCGDSWSMCLASPDSVGGGCRPVPSRQKGSLAQQAPGTRQCPLTVNCMRGSANVFLQTLHLLTTSFFHAHSVAIKC